MKLTLIRHTRLQVPEGICYGQSDIDVSASFHSELAQVTQKLAGEKIDAVYASPLQRCSKLAYTAAIFSPASFCVTCASSL